MSPSVMRAHAAELKGYQTGKGSIRFSAEQPLPACLPACLPASVVKKLVKARILENKERRQTPKQK